MKATSLSVAVVCVLLAPAFRAFGQYEYRFVFRGAAYQTNATGNVIAVPITDQTLLADRAQAGGITDLNSIAIVYHINADPKGDTVEIVSTNGTKLALEFGFWFGDDPNLGRIALTNATQTEIRRVDYLYTLENSTYTHSNPDSIGAAFVTKRFLTDGGGHVHATIEGVMSWMVVPQGGRGTMICTGNFTLGAPLF